MEIKQITPAADRGLAEMIRNNFRKHQLDIPGTVFFDPELDHLSRFYLGGPEKRNYFVLWDGQTVCGGVGFAEFPVFEKCAEIQKLYLADEAKGKGFGKALLSLAENEAKKAGYTKVYIETHTNFAVALQMYRRHGYTPIERPATVSHGAMNCFLMKEL